MYKQIYMKKLILFFVSIFTFLSISNPVLATKSFTQLGNPNIFAGEQINLDEPKYLKDVIIMSGQTNLDNTFAGDTIIMSGQTTFSPDTVISEDLLLLGGQQSISGLINKDVIVLGGETTITPDAIINGYLLALGGRVNMSGTVNDSVHIFAGQVNINNTAVIKGNLNINAGDISVADAAQVAGEKKINLHEEWNISEEWKGVKNTNISQFSQPARAYTRGFRQAFSLYSFLTHLLALLLLLKFFSTKINTLIKKGLKNIINTFKQGLVYLFIIPLAGILLITTIIGIPLAGFAFYVYGFSIYLSSIFTAIAIGQYLKDQKLFKTQNKYFYGFLGLIIINLLFSFPFLKGISKLASLLFGLGVFNTYLKQIFAKKK